MTFYISKSLENGEVIVGKSMKSDEDSEISQLDDIFAKRLSKLTSQNKISFYYNKLNTL